MVLTPEEWVRQHTIQYLIQQKNYLPSSIQAEHPVNLYGLNQRIDLLIYHKINPFMLIECKRPGVEITQETLDQAMRYNQMVQARFIYLTNGIQHIVAEIIDKELIFYPEIPHRFW